jgi:DNA-binding GntR family transcriptional regulator
MDDVQESSIGRVSGTPAQIAGALPMGVRVYDVLRRELLSIEIEPGDRLSVDALARRYGTSQTPVREALGRLAAEGLVVRTHLRGYRATECLTLSELESMFEFRNQIEPFAARRAAELRSDAQLDDLETVLAQMKASAVEDGHVFDYGEFAELDSGLHDTIAVMSGNPLIRESLSALHVHLHYFRLRRDRVVALDAVDEHQIIVDAIARHDTHVAEASMRSHLERSRQRLLGVIV